MCIDLVRFFLGMCFLKLKNTKTLVIIDVDNTLGDTYSRIRKATVLNKHSLNAIYSTLEPYYNNIGFINSLNQGRNTKSVVLTARNCFYRLATMSWLKKTGLCFSGCYHSNNLTNKLFFFKVGLLIMDELIIFDDFSEFGERYNEPVLNDELLLFVNSNNRIKHYGLNEILKIEAKLL